MYKFLLVLTVATLTACASKEAAPAKTTDSTAVAADTVKAVDSVVVDTTAK